MGPAYEICAHMYLNVGLVLFHADASKLLREETSNTLLGGHLLRTEGVWRGAMREN